MADAGMHIRSATAEDAPAMAQMIGELGYEGVTAKDVVARLPLLAEDGGEALVAELGGRIVGCLTTSKMRVLHRPAPVGRISMFVVASDLRGRGIGKALLDEAVRRLRADGCEMLEVTSNVRRTEAHAFYEHLGWERSSYRFTRED